MALEALSKNIGGISNTLGNFTESMFSMELWKKFNEIGFTFSQQAPRVLFIENNRPVAEADFFLQNDECAIVVEVEPDLNINDVDFHIERMEIIRKHRDARGDRRKLLGAVAGGIVPENVLKYAQGKGLFVIMQNGDAVSIAEAPQGFKAREWA